MKVKEDDIRVNKETGEVEICSEVIYTGAGIERHWEDYDTHLLASTLGQCEHSTEFYPLLRYKERFDMTKADMEAKEKSIKIRYAYLGSPTNLETDPAYCETLRFKVLTIAELELRPNRLTLEELITDNKEALIRILGRDRCTDLVDMNATDIYENDIIRWFPERSTGYIDVLVKYERHKFILWEGDWLPDTEIHCKVIGTKYDKEYMLGEDK